MRFVSRSVLTGFVNALAILIFMAQMPELIGKSWESYAMIAAGLAIIYLCPRLTKAVPSPLVCIVVLTVASLTLGLDVRTVGDLGELPSSLPTFLIPNVLYTLETLWIIFPYSVGVAAGKPAYRIHRRSDDRHKERQESRVRRPGCRQLLHRTAIFCPLRVHSSRSKKASRRRLSLRFSPFRGADRSSPVSRPPSRLRWARPE